MFADHHPQAVEPFAQLGKGFVKQQKACHPLATVAQAGQHGLRALPGLLGLALNQADRHLAGILKGEQRLGFARRQAQFEAAQANQTAHLLPPRPACGGLALPFGSRQFVATRCTAPALDWHPLHPDQPAEGQQPNPIQHGIGAIFPDVRARAGGTGCWAIRQWQRTGWGWRAGRWSWWGID